MVYALQLRKWTFRTRAIQNTTNGTLSATQVKKGLTKKESSYAEGVETNESITYRFLPKGKGRHLHHHHYLAVTNARVQVSTCALSEDVDNVSSLPANVPVVLLVVVVFVSPVIIIYYSVLIIILYNGSIENLSC